MLRFYAIGPWILVPLGLVGLVIAAPRMARADYYVWLAFVPSFAISVAAFFIAERYRLPLLIPLCIGAGAAVDVAWRALEKKQLNTLLVPGVAFLVIFGLANWRHGLHDGRWEEGLRMAERLVVIGRYDEAEQWVQKLEPEAPRRGMVDYTVGVAYLSKNETARALAHLTKAQQADPGRPNVEYALGQALLRDDKPQQAVPYLAAWIRRRRQRPAAGIRPRRRARKDRGFGGRGGRDSPHHAAPTTPTRKSGCDSGAWRRRSRRRTRPSRSSRKPSGCGPTRRARVSSTG